MEIPRRSNRRHRLKGDKMKAVKWYCENCGTTVIPGEEIEWDETVGCPGCGQEHMTREEKKPKRNKNENSQESE
jgi:predicted RNA-binding Zn-ribbon protein involved in translation (DUF1610 family)